MRINVAIYDTDKVYTNRLVNGLQTNFARQVSVKSFSDEQIFKTELLRQHFDIAIIAQDFVGLSDSIPDRTLTMVFTSDNGIEEFDRIPAVGKYQSVEKIYKRIIGVYADNAGEMKISKSGSASKIIMVTSVQGGVGTSSLAAAYALHLARKNKRIFYLNLENFGTSNSFFAGDGQGSFSDIIYALKSKNINFAMKLQSTIKKDTSGVQFIDGCRNAYDMLELTDSEISELLEGISAVQEFDAIVVDYSGTMNERQQMLMKKYADVIIYVNDGSDIGNDKFIRFCEAVRIIEKKEDCSILNKMSLVYNRYSSHTSSQLEEVPVTLLGGINRIEGISGRELANELAKKDSIFNI